MHRYNRIIFNDKKSVIYFSGVIINLLNYYHHHDTKYFQDSLVMLNHNPCINQPTRITTATATLIYNILTNSIFFFQDVVLLLMMLLITFLFLY